MYVTVAGEISDYWGVNSDVSGYADLRQSFEIVDSFPV